MSEYFKTVLDTLQTAGNRITTPRKLITSILEKSEQPLSPYKIQEKLNQFDLNVDVATIYRNMDYLQSVGLVHYIWSEKGYIRCRCINDEGTHIFLKCLKCGSFFEKAVRYKGELEVFFNRNIRESIKNVYIELDIVCNECANSSGGS